MAENVRERGVERAPMLSDSTSNRHYTSHRGICFHGVTYNVAEGLCSRTTKTILDDISGTMEPGLNAIMGPTGSGKTSLLDILAGRKNKKGLQGTVLINGEEQSRNFKYISGYVVQDDRLMGTLTVKENLYFSAALRLPNSISWKEKKQRVKKIIDDLGLNRCVDTKIGNEFIRGVSGGERKRTSIGMELITEPEFLFLDEPTTGLDAFTAISIVQLLKNLSIDGSRVIIMTIHQPRYSIYKLFDTLTLLSMGQMIYHGAMNNCLDYFSTLGYKCEEHDNPADFLLDVINKCESQSTLLSDELAVEQGERVVADVKVDLAEAYIQSNECKTTRVECERIVSNRQVQFGSTRYSFLSRAKYTTNFLWQLLVVLLRSVVDLARNPMTSFLQVRPLK